MHGARYRTHHLPLLNLGRCNCRPLRVQQQRTDNNDGSEMKKYQDTNQFLEDMCVSSYVALPFALYTLVLLLFTTQTDAHWLHADPILTIFPSQAHS